MMCVDRIGASGNREILSTSSPDNECMSCFYTHIKYFLHGYNCQTQLHFCNRELYKKKIETRKKNGMKNKRSEESLTMIKLKLRLTTNQARGTGMSFFKFLSLHSTEVVVNGS